MFTPLKPDESRALGDFLLGELRNRPLDLEEGNLAGEVSITAGWVRPLIEAAVSSLGHLGLTVAGDGGLKVKPLPVFGLLFSPDVTVFYYEQPLFALEVKLARRGSGQGAVTRALGQATIYQVAGFPMAAILILNAGGLPSSAESQRDLAGVPVVVRPVPENLPAVREERD